MSKMNKDPMQALTGPGAEAFRLWISFFPIAPAFGVRWAFSDAMPGLMPGASPTAEHAAEPEPAPVAHERVGGQMDPETAAALAEAQVEAQVEVNQILAALDEASLDVAEAVATGTEAPTAIEETAAESGAEPEAASVVLPFPAAAEAQSALIHPPATLYHVAPAETDDLKLIKGIGPGLETRLNALGIYRFDQIAGFSEQDLHWIDSNMTTFKGRCFRDDWVGQARALLS